jgi:hypothetical protein
VDERTCGKLRHLATSHESRSKPAGGSLGRGPDTGVS